MYNILKGKHAENPVGRCTSAVVVGREGTRTPAGGPRSGGAASPEIRPEPSRPGFVRVAGQRPVC